MRQEGEIEGQTANGVGARARLFRHGWKMKISRTTSPWRRAAKDRQAHSPQSGLAAALKKKMMGFGA